MELYNYKIFIQQQMAKNGGLKRYDKQRYAMKLFWYLKKKEYPMTLKQCWSHINNMFLDKWETNENATLDSGQYYENSKPGTYTGD